MKKSAIAVLGFILMLASVSWASVCPDIQYLDTYQLNSPLDGTRLAAGADGVVYVADAEGGYLKVLGRDGSLLENKRIPDIIGVGVDADGFVYVGTAKDQRGGYAGEVKVYDAGLRYVMSLGRGAGEFKFPVAITADATKVYVADQVGDVVKVYGRVDGAYITSMGGGGSATTSTPWPTDVAIHPATGNLHVPNHSIFTTTTATSFVDSTGKTVTIPAGSTYGAAVHTFGTNGAFLGKITFLQGYQGLDGMVASPSGAMIDSQGRLYVTDGTIGDMQIFDDAGGFICRYSLSASTLYPKTPRMTTDGRLAIATSSGILFFTTEEYVSLKASASDLSFTKQACASAPAAKAITVTNEGTGTLTWSASADAAWIMLGSSSGSIAGAGSQEFMVSVNADGLDVGTHTGTVSVTSNGGNAELVVTIYVYAAPTLTVTGGTYNFVAQGGTIPAAGPLGVILSGDRTGSLGWSATASAPWIAVVPASGPSNTEALAGVGIGAAGLAGLSSGSYSGNITVSAGCLDVPDVTIPISLVNYAGGTIGVSTNLASASFSVTGPATYTGGGISGFFYDAPDGAYTVMYGSVQGYLTPPESVIEVAAGRTASASGNYIDLRQRNNIIVTMGGVITKRAKTAVIDDDVVILDADGRKLDSINISADNASGQPLGGSVTAAGDFDGDGIDEVVVAEKGGMISGFAADGLALPGFQFRTSDDDDDYAISLDLAAGDVDGDGLDELIVASTTDAAGVDPVVSIYKYASATGVAHLLSFRAFDTKKGANIAAGDIDGDGKDEVLATEAGIGARKVNIRIFALDAGVIVDAGSIAAGNSYSASDISAGDIDADGVDEIVITSSATRTDNDRVTGYKATGEKVLDFKAPAKGIRIAVGDVDFDGEAEVVVSEGILPASQTTIRTYSADGSLAGEFKAFNNPNIYGASVSLGRSAGQ